MLVRYDPFRELDRAADEFFGGARRATAMPMNPPKLAATAITAASFQSTSPNRKITTEIPLITVASSTFSAFV